MDIEFVRSRLSNTLTAKPEMYMHHPDASISSENTLTITEDLFFRELLTKE